VTDPHRRDRTRPLELLGISAVLAIFVGVFVFVGTRAFDRALIFAGVAFVIALVVLAMLMLAVGPKDLDKSDDDQAPPTGDKPDDTRSPH
jgi:amino acid permease